MEEVKQHNCYDILIRQNEEVIGYASCNLFGKVLQIRSLFVINRFRGRGIGEVLLSKVLDYAREQAATRIVAYCGAEPFCEGGQIPIDQEQSWYEVHGFVHDHNVMGVTPCMIKDII